MMAQCLTLEGEFGNPSSLHAYGTAARKRVEQARAQVAAFIGAKPVEITWTSGATEANNLAILGVARFNRPLRAIAQAGGQARGQIITSRTEHKAVLDA